MEGTVPRILKTFFLGSSAISHVFWAIPSLNAGMRAYGARSQPADAAAATVIDEKPAQGEQAAAAAAANDQKPPSSTLAEKLLRFGSDLRVPHSWFTGFYIWSSICSAVWGQQLYTRGPLFQLIARYTNFEGKPSMSFNQMILVWGLFQVQGLRRLYESFAFSKPSKSTMNFLIFGIGILYYAAMSISMWIEGLPALMSTSKPFGDASFSAPSLRSIIGIPLFIIASGVQYDCHHYLWSLKKYTVPEHPAFGKVLAPHYLAEVLIYVSLTLLGAPQGKIVNKSLVIGTLFVVLNLAAEADNTKAWYERKFGKDKVQGKDRIIPYLW